MAVRKLDDLRLKAGSDYLSALISLGLEPDGLFWAFEKAESRWVLALVTNYFDVAGPLNLSEVLFKAYRAAATPREIDPFMVRMFSPKQAFIRDISAFLANTRITVRDWDEESNSFGQKYLAQERADVAFGNESYEVPINVVYRLKDPRRDKVDLARKWAGIERRVKALAA